MSHSGNNDIEMDDSFHKMVESVQEANKELYGEYPDGRLNKHDQGAVAFAVGSEKGRVILRFPKKITWMGMTGDEAMELAQLLITHAKQAGLKKPATIEF